MKLLSIKEYGEELKRKRIAKNLTQKDLAKITGISEQTIIKLERNTIKNISILKLTALLKAVE